MFLQIVCFDPKHSLPLSIFTFPLPTEHSSFASMSFNSSIPTLVFKPSTQQTSSPIYLIMRFKFIHRYLLYIYI